jgi:hypothetical protein
MLRITVHEDKNKARIEACGKIAGPWVAELENAWRAVEAPGREIEVDLKDVTYVDEAARQLLERMHRAGARLIARGLLMNELVDEIAGLRPARVLPNTWRRFWRR